MKRRTFQQGMAAWPAALAWPASAQPTRPYRVAWVSTERAASPSPNLMALRSGLRDLGYREGVDLLIDAWWSEGSADQVTQRLPEILRTQPDLVVAAGGLALGALVRSGITLPIVFSISSDPVEARLIDSFAHPGGRMTGISLFTLALVVKRLALIREFLPKARRVALIVNPQHPGERLELAAAQAAATQLGLALHYCPVTTEAELEAALSDIAAQRDDAIVAFADGFTMGFAGRIAAFGLQHRIPAVNGWAPFARAGNLAIYGPVIADVYRRLALYVDKIRKGAKPADLPVELPTRVELVVNRRTARAMGLVVPATVLARADEVDRVSARQPGASHRRRVPMAQLRTLHFAAGRQRSSSRARSRAGGTGRRMGGLRLRPRRCAARGCWSAWQDAPRGPGWPLPHRANEVMA